MASLSYWKARTYVLRGLVILENSTYNNLYFKVKEYSVTYDLRKKHWTCGCPHGSIWGKGLKHCSHIKAAVRWLKQKEGEVT